MGVTTIRPNLAALSDDTDTTYDELLANIANGSPITRLYSFSAAALSLPAGAQVRNVAPRVRWGQSLGVSTPSSATATFALVDPSGTSSADQFLQNPAGGVFVYTSTNLTQRPTRVDGSAWTAALIKASSLQVQAIRPGSSYSQVRVAEAYLDVTYNEAPVATPGAALGTVGTSRPTFSWSYTDPDGDAQEQFRVKVFASTNLPATDAEILSKSADLDSGWIAGNATSWTPTTDLVNGTTYRAFILVSDAGSGGRTNVLSTGTYQSVTLSITAPNAPAISAPTFDAVTRRVAFTLSATNNIAGALSYLFEVQRSTDGGTTWTAVSRLQDTTLKFPAYGSVNYAAVGSPSVALFDYEAPYGSVLYRARVVAINSLSAAVVSLWTVSTAVTVTTPSRWYIKSLYDATLNLAFYVNSAELVSSSTERQSVNQALGRRNPLMLSDAIGGESFDLELSILSKADNDALEAMRAPMAVMLLENAEGERLYFKFGATRTATRTVGIIGKRRVKIPFIEQDAPV